MHILYCQFIRPFTFHAIFFKYFKCNFLYHFVNNISGYYLGIVTHHIQLNEKAEVKYSEKITNTLLKVKKLIDEFPRTNVEDQDILQLAETIRANYKKACALLKISSANPYDEGVSFWRFVWYYFAFVISSEILSHDLTMFFTNQLFSSSKQTLHHVE